MTRKQAITRANLLVSESSRLIAQLDRRQIHAARRTKAEYDQVTRMMRAAIRRHERRLDIRAAAKAVR